MKITPGRAKDHDLSATARLPYKGAMLAVCAVIGPFGFKAVTVSASDTTFNRAEGFCAWRGPHVSKAQGRIAQPPHQWRSPHRDPRRRPRLGALAVSCV